MNTAKTLSLIHICLENLGEKLMKSENFEMAIGEIVWLITLLANQSILVFNLSLIHI